MMGKRAGGPMDWRAGLHSGFLPSFLTSIYGGFPDKFLIAIFMIYTLPLLNKCVVYDCNFRWNQKKLLSEFSGFIFYQFKLKHRAGFEVWNKICPSNSRLKNLKSFLFPQHQWKFNDLKFFQFRTLTEAFI